MGARVCWGLSLAFGCALAEVCLAQSPPDVGKSSTNQTPPPVELTAHQDHQRMMDLLHITALRPGVNGMNPQAPDAANYDEAKANPYPVLPDPLILKSGKMVTTPGAWWKQRRPEIVGDFDSEVYGRVPTHVPKVTWVVTSTTKATHGDIPVITKLLAGHVAITQNILPYRLTSS